jgi:hypothetical protein
MPGGSEVFRWLSATSEDKDNPLKKLRYCEFSNQLLVDLEKAGPWLTEELWECLEGSWKIMPKQRLKMAQIVLKMKVLAEQAGERLRAETELVEVINESAR